mgnify:CR=1 FL=1|jgi:hypothetical protein
MTGNQSIPFGRRMASLCVASAILAFCVACWATILAAGPWASAAFLAAFLACAISTIRGAGEDPRDGEGTGRKES